MFIPTLIMAVLAIALLFTGYCRGDGQHMAGLKSALSMISGVLPLLIFAFIVAGMAQVLLPQELVSKWIGAESGIRGILLGSVAGGLTPGGPYVSLPIATGLMKSGASVGTLVAFLTGWSLWSVARIPMEVAILGWQLTLVRISSTFFIPPVAGIIAQALFGGAK
jgi:uncharacterized membrane protein YraQ (UPF0718 family)